MASTTRDDDRFAHLTEAQREAIRTTDRSLLVSAAAGSGKTTVLAERCAYLVCDLPADQRCRVNELLVVTFTDAAAGEMRQRIGKAIRQRIELRLHRRDAGATSDGNRSDGAATSDEYLRSQLYLLDSASISTIHAFCKTIVEKWFPQAGVDPQPAVLSSDEAELLRRGVLDTLFGELYARADELGAGFANLVDQYGAGDDRQIGEVVLAIHDFTNSLPDRERWLDQAVRQVDPDALGSFANSIDARQADRLRDELARYIECAEHAASTIRRTWPQAVSRAEAVEVITTALHAWREQLANSPEKWEEVATSIAAYEFAKLKSKPRGLSEADGAAYDAAKDCLDRLKKQISGSLTDKVCRFTAAEYRDGFVRSAPYVRTLVDLVRELDRLYGETKAAQAAVDFNDLQRYALKLLADEDHHERPSAIARQLQQQYRYVLVDEFQDVDPLQAEILRLVSRESADPPSGNLFTVGDIKQSIYRFRLAEPRLFSDRADEFGQEGAAGRVIHLQENFRSREGIIEGVNAVFRCLMSRQFGGSAYDAHAELHRGAIYPTVASGPLFERPAVEVHLLEPIVQRTQVAEDANASEESRQHVGSVPDGGEETEATEGENEPASREVEELEGIEREAYPIAERIRSWMGQDGGARCHVAGKPASPDEPPTARPIEYGDIVILLRAMPHKAEPIADVLRRMSIPVRLEGANSQLDSMEFNDVYSLLAVLDNRQQDIPLAALLRGPMLGDPLSESELLELRLIDCVVPFYAAVMQYATRGGDATLCRRLGDILARLDHYRSRVQREPLAEVLWDIYEQTGYLSYVAGLPDGARRHGHLIRLHELARQFGQFARQGLRRFLRFLDEMLEQERGGPPVSAGAGGDNAVRIMTIHASKGLEFPVVILADLSKKFNLTDTRGVALVDRELGLALQVADAQRRVRYPTLLHQIAAERASRECLSEELRVLYVALTRAREHLVLIGRCPLSRVEQCKSLTGSGSPPPRMELESATCALDWLLPAMAAMPARLVHWTDRDSAGSGDGLFSVAVYDRRTTDSWRIPPAQPPETMQSLARIGRLEPLPPAEPASASEEVQQTIAALDFIYPGLELTSLPARQSVSDLKRAWAADRESEDRPAGGTKTARPVARPAFLSDGPVEMDSVARGIATHRLLQVLDLTRPCDAEDLRQQRDAIVEANRMPPSDAAAVNLEDIAWFFATDLGVLVRRLSGHIQREVPFVSRVPPERVNAMAHARDHRDVLLVRGMVDLLICGQAELSILDFKTDDVSAEVCDQRAEAYRPQLAYYAEAMAAAYHLPVAHRWLVFLKARRIVELQQTA